LNAENPPKFAVFCYEELSSVLDY